MLNSIIDNHDVLKEGGKLDLKIILWYGKKTVAPVCQRMNHKLLLLKQRWNERERERTTHDSTLFTNLATSISEVQMFNGHLRQSWKLV